MRDIICVSILRWNHWALSRYLKQTFPLSSHLIKSTQQYIVTLFILVFVCMFWSGLFNSCSMWRWDCFISNIQRFSGWLWGRNIRLCWKSNIFQIKAHFGWNEAFSKRSGLQAWNNKNFRRHVVPQIFTDELYYRDADVMRI